MAIWGPIKADKKESSCMNSKRNMGASTQAYINQQNIAGPVGILWDIENCAVPSDVRPEDVAGNIRMALRAHPSLQGAVVKMFSAYGDFSAFPRRLREGCQRTGVKLVDVPNGRKDAADKAILVDMFLFALDNPPPSSIMLISGDVDFSPALHILGQRGYNVILVIPAGVGVSVSPALSNAGRFLWDWPSVARGEVFVPPKTLMSCGSSQVVGCCRGCHLDEEAIEPCSTDANNLSPGLNNVPAMPANDGDLKTCVQPEDVIGLKAQLVKLLELSGGCLSLFDVIGEYNQKIGQPLFGAEYGANKLVNLLKKRADTMTEEEEGQQKYVYLRNANERHEKVENSIQSAGFPKKDETSMGCQDETVNICTIPECSSGELSDDDKAAAVGPTSKSNDYLKQFKQEMQEVLVSCFEEMYHVAPGEGFVPSKILLSCVSSQAAGYHSGCQINGNPDTQNDEEATVDRGITHNEYAAQTNINQMCSNLKKSQSLSEYANNLDLHSLSTSRSKGLSPGLNDVPEILANEDDRTTFIQPGDIIGLKGQFVKLLELSGGCLPLDRFTGEYHKKFGRQLCMAEYGVNKLANLLMMMADIMTVEGEGQKRDVYLRIAHERHEKVKNSNQSAVFPKKDETSIGDETVSINVCTIPECSSDELSEDDKAAVVGPTSKSDDCLKRFNQKMQEPPVSCSSKNHLESSEEMYNLACGEGFVPPNTLVSCGSSQVAGHHRECQINENPDTQNNEAAIVDKGITHNEYAAQTNINEMCSNLKNSQSLSEYTNNLNLHCLPTSRSGSPPPGLNDVPAIPANEEDPTTCVQPGDIIGLKAQMVKLLELSGGCLLLARVPEEYNKIFRRPLCMSEYGVDKLANLLRKMADTMTVAEGKKKAKCVYLLNANERHEKVESSNQSADFPEKDKRGKECQEETVNIYVPTIPGCTSGEFSDDDKGAVVEPASK